MEGTPGGTEAALLAQVLVPVADEDDARATCDALDGCSPGRMTAVNVIEKGEGAPEGTPVERIASVAETAFEAVREGFPATEGETDENR